MRFEQKDDALLWRHDRQTLEIRSWREDVIRVRATVNPAFVEATGALVDDRATPSRIEVGEHAASLRSGRLEARVTDYGRLRFLWAAGSQPDRPSATVLEEVDWLPSQRMLYPEGRSFASLDSDLFRTEARFLSHPGERFYGLGQHRHGLLDQKGAVIELLQRNAEVSIPFILSSRGYGFLWNNPAVGRVELATTGTRWVAEACRQLDYVVVGGSTPGEILERYADITGHPSPFPEWAGGFWQSKLRYATQDEVLRVAREYRRRGLPLAVIVVDFFHWTRQGEWRWDPVAWPDPDGMARQLADMGVHLMVSVWPTVNPRSSNTAEMRERGYLVGTNRGLDLLLPMRDPGEERAFMHLYDATNPEARAFIWERIKENYLDRGVSLFWLDACEPEIYPVEPGNLRFHLGTGLEVACAYPALHARGIFEGMVAAGGNDVISLCRSAWAGSQAFGAAVWSGDIPSTWESLRAQVRAGLNIGMSGIPWWTTDIGGFYGGDLGDPDFRELVIRWFQYGAFCPLFRIHGVRTGASSRTGGGDDGALGSGADNEIWSFGDDAYEIMRQLLFVRERLRPYIVAQMQLASERGTPPMRPLFFDYPAEEALWDVDDEFLLGPDLVVAPVLEPGARSRRVYLPADAVWCDAWTGRPVPAGRWFTARAPLESIPVFMKNGSALGLLGPSPINAPSDDPVGTARPAKRSPASRGMSGARPRRHE